MDEKREVSKYIAVACLALLLSACSVQVSVEASQLVILYKGEVAPGNAIVSFLNYNDPTGQYASKHCEALRHVYSSNEGVPYVCSTVVFPEFQPKVR